MAVATALLELIWTLNKDESEHYCLPDISITGGEGGGECTVPPICDVQPGHRFQGISVRRFIVTETMMFGDLGIYLRGNSVNFYKSVVIKSVSKNSTFNIFQQFHFLLFNHK